MHTLEQLRSGQLKGIKRLTLREELSSFPKEILSLSDSLEILDLSHNALSTLPEEISQLKKLKIAFFSHNRFTEVPSVFKDCEKLYMLGFKANEIEVFDEGILPSSISWLILTDNKIKSLPRSIGQLNKLQKCALAGNRLESLPEEMAACKNLELLRLSANRLKEIPAWLLQLPKLSWLAFSGNPCTKQQSFSLDEVAYEDLELKELLGEGASGEIYRAFSSQHKKEVALKLFKGDVTSDGYAKDEMNAYMSTGEHHHLIRVLARVKGDDHLGLLLELIPSEYKNLGLPPDFDTCTRDTFDEGTSFTLERIEAIGRAIVSAAAHLHERGLMHGDLYAHNILINDKHRAYLGDFGAASFYEDSETLFERIEVRAFGCLLDDLLRLATHKEGESFASLLRLSQRCMHEEVAKRPLFKEILIG